MLRELIDKWGALVVDGAMATQLEARGCDINDSLWSAKILFEAPHIIRAVHADYYEAGADIGITASYQASLPGFMSRGFSEEQAADLIRLSVRLACEARDEFWSAYTGGKRPRPLVAGSVGPYGAYLADGSEYRGDYTASPAALRDFHRPRIELLAQAGCDLLACETLPCLREAIVLAELAAQYSLPCWISFSCMDGEHICEGTPIAECGQALAGESAVEAVGVNCTPPQYVADLIGALSGSTAKPIIVYPNSGEVYDALSKTWHGDAQCGYGDYAGQWLKAGARLIGGCCRTTPDDVRTVRKLVEMEYPVR